MEHVKRHGKEHEKEKHHWKKLFTELKLKNDDNEA